MKITIEYKYNNYLKQINNILAHPNYLGLYSNDFGWICGYEDDKLCYLLPFIQKRKLIFSYIIFTSETIKVNESNFKEKDFLNNVVIKLKESSNIDFIAQPFPNVVFNDYPNGSIYAPFGSYEIDLSLSEDELFKQIHSKHKNVIRRAINNNVIIKFGNNELDNAYEIINDTLTRNNISFLDKKKFIDFIEKNKNNILIGVSYYDNEPQSSAIVIYDNNRGYYFWGGSKKDMFLGANNLLHWKIIKKLKNLGVKKYDFVGARIEPKTEKLKGIQRFKSRFGANMRKGYLWKYVLNRPKFFLYLQILKLWTLMNGMKFKGDIIDQERNR